MQKGTVLIATTAIAMALATASLPAGPASAADPHTAGGIAGSAQLSTDLYKGFRATSFLGSSVFSAKGEYLGAVRNIIISRDGRIESAVVEGGGAANDPEFIFRVPWDRLLLPVHTGALIANLSDSGAREFGLFLNPEAGNQERSSFQASKLIGDYARLQAGQGYGYVSDLVFSPTGSMVAVLVARDKQAGGGTIAFAYPEKLGKWSPAMSYYGLPYVTAEQANRAGMAVNMRAFADAKS